MIITFGKFKGQKIKELPSSYLKWLLQNIPNEDVVQEVRKVLLDRLLVEYSFDDEGEENYESFGIDTEWWKD